jgi:NAD(P)-dependent dehydrogenase (short-subunit alcohol dehydrogenase family)
MRDKTKTELEEQVAIVTGAATGIGRGIAHCLARRGAAIVVADIDAAGAERTAAEIRDIGNSAIALQVDIRNSIDVAAMVDKSLEAFGKIDILVNNAGISGFSPVWQLAAEEWDDVFAVNVKGTFLCTRAVSAQMMQRKSGKIVNIASVSGMVTKFLYQTHYCASKAAVISFTRAVALELAPYNINVNGISPGVTVSEQTRNLLLDTEDKERILQMVPFHRFGQPENIGEAVAFLVGPNSSFMTGSIVVVDGGMIAG